ncbi:MAG: hypothetical protein M1300_11115, partial [Epsilonproteobacteria bacterium]|nr:hypothetical protein [Campylobacterota bacterium]
TLKTSTGQSSSVRISSMSEAEMIKAELEAASFNGTNAEAKKDEADIAGKITPFLRIQGNYALIEC